MFIAFLFPIIGFIIFLIGYSNEKPIKAAKKKYGKQEFLFFAKLKLLMGPELPPCDLCNVVFLKSRIVIETHELVMNVATEKLVSVRTMTREQVQRQVYSDAGGAMAGAMLFGAAGAVIGGTGVRTTKGRTDYLVIAYIGDGDLRYMLFDVTGKGYKASEIVKKYAWLKNREKIQVNLSL